MKTKQRIIVVLNDHKQDLGIWDYRCLSNYGIDAGSCVNLAKLLQDGAKESGTEAPGLIISNAGQLTYSHKYHRAMTIQSWQAMPRSSLFCPVVHEHPIHNAAEGNRDKTEHAEFIFENILKNSAWARQDAEIYIIGILNGGEVALKYLNSNWHFWSSRVAAIALTSVFTKRQTLSWEMIQFLRDRARNWKISGAPKDACLVSPLHWTLQIPDTRLVEAPVDVQDEAEREEDVNGNDNGHAKDLVAATVDGEEELTEWAISEPKAVIPDPQIICPEFSSSVQDFTEVIFPTVLESVVSFFKEVQMDVTGYKNPPFTVDEWKEDPLEVELPDLNDGVEKIEKDAEMMTLEEFNGKEGGKEKKTNEQVKIADEKVQKVRTKAVPKQDNDNAVIQQEQLVDSISLDTLDPLGSHPIRVPTEPQITVAGVDLDEELLKAAGLM